MTAQNDDSLQGLDPYARAERNTFVNHALDRVHARRTDEAWIREALRAPDTHLVIVQEEQILLARDVSPHLPALAAEWQQALSRRQNLTDLDIVFLGRLRGHHYFALSIERETDLPDGAVEEAADFLSLRSAALQLDPGEAALASQAKAMIHWHHAHQFCGWCGDPTHGEEGGYVRRCTNPECGKLHFPRIDPAIIVLVTHKDRGLLGRQPTWPERMYSNIAGFVEPGESLETAVGREVWEETGVRIRRVTYHSSQPWPFPRSLMVGFHAEAASEAITLNDGELEDARWFTREAIQSGLAEGWLSLPSAYSISYHLIEDWYDAGAEEPLSQVLSSG
jgi:NAD+ diphosphatase